ncbi:MAG: hypothetical protein U0Y68_16555 [Blastocatellia bacterium]
MQITEQSRRGLVNPATRAEYRRRQQSLYELSVETLLRRRAQDGDEQFAAQASPSSNNRARSLLDLLHEAQVDIRQGVAPRTARAENATCACASQQSRTGHAAEREQNAAGTGAIARSGNHQTHSGTNRHRNALIVPPAPRMPR